jgi:hypothetical protein
MASGKIMGEARRSTEAGLLDKRQGPGEADPEVAVHLDIHEAT